MSKLKGGWVSPKRPNQSQGWLLQSNRRVSKEQVIERPRSPTSQLSAILSSSQRGEKQFPEGFKLCPRDLRLGKPSPSSVAIGRGGCQSSSQLRPPIPQPQVSVYRQGSTQGEETPLSRPPGTFLGGSCGRWSHPLHGGSRGEDCPKWNRLDGKGLRWGGVLETELTIGRKIVLEAKALGPGSSSAKWGC